MSVQTIKLGPVGSLDSVVTDSAIGCPMEQIDILSLDLLRDTEGISAVGGCGTRETF